MFKPLFRSAACAIAFSLIGPTCVLADGFNFKLGPPFYYVVTSYDGYPQPPKVVREAPKQKTLKEEQDEQAENAKLRAQIIRGVKFDAKSNSAFMEKEYLVLEDVSPANWAFITHLPKLKEAFVVYEKPRDFKQGVFNALATCPSLGKLTIHGDPSNANLTCFRDHPTLKSVSFVRPDVPVKSIKEIVAIRGLEQLSLSNPRFTQEGIDAIGKMSSLRRLSLVGEILKDGQVPDFTPLAELSNLEYLNIVAPIGGAQADQLSKLQHVQFLNLGNVLAKNLVCKVAQIPTLLGAAFWSTTVSNEDIDVLKCRGIKFLELKDDFEPGAFERLSEIKSLETLIVASKTITPDQLLSLKNLPNLKYLLFQGNANCNPYSASILSKARPDLMIEGNIGYAGCRGESFDICSFYEAMRASILDKIRSRTDVPPEKLDELFFLSSYKRDDGSYTLLDIRDEVAFAFAKAGCLDQAERYQRESYAHLMPLFGTAGHNGQSHMPAMDLSNGVRGYILGKQRKFAMAIEAFEKATEQPGLFIGLHSKEIATVYEDYAEILRDAGNFDSARIQENKAKFIRANPPMMNTTHSTDTRYWPTPENPKPF
jgi:tetratricopeptide (TPR) repeat protein